MFSGSTCSSGGLISIIKQHIVLAMGFSYFCADTSSAGGGLNSLSGDEACADLNVHTLPSASDIDLIECIFSQTGMDAVVCALTNVIRNWKLESEQHRLNDRCMQSRCQHLKAFLLVPSYGCKPYNLIK